MKKQKIKIFILIFLLIPGILFAAEKEFTVLLEDADIEPGRQTAIELVFDKGDDVKIPEMPFMPGIQFQYDSTSDGSSFDNNFTHGYKVYKYNVLATREGTFTIGPLVFSYGNTIYRSPEVILNVMKDSRVHSENAEKPSDPEKDISKHIFARLICDKEKLFPYENFIIRLEIYSDWLDLTDVKVFKPHSVSIISDDFHRTRTKIVELKGVKYVVLEFEKNAFTPESGDFTFGPARVKCNISRPEVLSGGKVRDLLNDNASFYYTYLGRKKYKPLELFTNDILITITDLPVSGRPRGFSGAIGSFKVEYKIDKSAMASESIILYKTRISGAGNFNTVNMPLITKEAGCTIISGTKKRYGEKGLILKQEVKIDHAIADTIPGIEFIFFDPLKMKYQVVSQDPIPLSVDPKKNEVAEQVKNENVKKNYTDFVPIKNYPVKFSYGYEITAFGTFFYTIQILPFVLLAVALYYKRQIWIMTSDTDKAVYIRASRKASAEFFKALLMFRKKKKREFYDIIFNLIRDYIGERMNVPAGSFTEDNIEKMLPQGGQFDNVRVIIREIFSMCYLSRYTEYTTTTLQMKEVLIETRRLLNILNREKSLRSFSDHVN